VLSDRDKRRLVVSSRVDRRHFVSPSRQSCGHVSGKETINRRGVQPLEKRKLGRVSRCGLAQRVECFDDDVRVTDDESLAVQLLGCSKVVLLRVHEMASLEVGDGQRDHERLVGRDRSKVGGIHEFRGWHVRFRGDQTHRRRVARSRRDL